MNFHALIEWIKYTWRAKSRHGVHSPFAYDLVENVIQNTDTIDRRNLVELPGLGLRHQNLANRIKARYGYRNIIFLSPEKEVPAGSVDIFVLSDKDVAYWPAMVEKYAGMLQNGGCFLITGIHRNAVCSAMWGKTSIAAKSWLKIDLYGMGLVFVKDEFKENQQFVLKT